MTSVVKATEPERRMGVYKRLDDVPDRYRLGQHAAAFEGRDVWGEYIEAKDEEEGLSEWYLERAKSSERSWKDHVDHRGQHHALATPEDVETWCAALLPDRKLRTVYERYWVQLESFYRWLQFHTEYPHVYNPVLMAAAEYEAAGRVWEYKIEQGRERAREREKHGRR